ncbi:MAG: alkylresorcinol O-methyltransferase [Chloroflexi bacterium]|nr:alkylresorcinol O-methyltransferase [Chloroflexota bacterium]
MGVKTYTLLLAAIGIGRLIELRHSRANQQALATRGIVMAAEPHFRWMALLHAGVLASSAIEIVLAKRPWVPALAIPMALVLVGANLLRWWVIRTMGQHWNVRVMDSVRLGVVSDGPFRWIRHPNYVAVFLELEAIPLLHSAWVTALLGGFLHLWVLSRRLAVEEPILLADPTYRTAMAWKPRFVPFRFVTDVGCRYTDNLD